MVKNGRKGASQHAWEKRLPSVVHTINKRVGHRKISKSAVNALCEILVKANNQIVRRTGDLVTIVKPCSTIISENTLLIALASVGGKALMTELVTDTNDAMKRFRKEQDL